MKGGKSGKGARLNCSEKCSLVCPGSAASPRFDSTRGLPRGRASVHDELVLEVPEGEVEAVKTELPALMSGVAELAVPIPAEVGVGPNWERAH